MRSMSEQQTTREPVPQGSEQRAPSVNLSEMVWKVGNVLATVVRVVALLFAIVLAAHIVLTLVGVNPANGVAQFVGGVANTVVLGFRDLFLPTDPTVFTVVNFGLAAVFWILVGEILSRLLRFVAARLA